MKRSHLLWTLFPLTPLLFLNYDGKTDSSQLVVLLAIHSASSLWAHDCGVNLGHSLHEFPTALHSAQSRELYIALSVQFDFEQIISEKYSSGLLISNWDLFKFCHSWRFLLQFPLCLLSWWTFLKSVFLNLYFWLTEQG
jgi:hypothetical protein